MRWPWTRRFEVSNERLEEARRTLAETKAYEARTRRISKAAERAITQNHFAADMQRAMEGR